MPELVARPHPHSEGHRPLGQLYACMECGKVTLRLINNDRTEQFTTWMTMPEVRTYLSKLRNDFVMRDAL